MGVEIDPVVQVADVETAAADELAQVLRDDSNLEMDWLWLATKVESNWLRRYCLQRALLINPHSALAKRGLAQLKRGGTGPLNL